MSISMLAVISAMRWFRRLGGPGLIPLGIADASVVPLPGSMDALTIVLAASNRDWWPYYATMATVGAIVGAYLTYRLGRKGGEKGLEKKLSRRRFATVQRAFEKSGFAAVFVPALLPPPVPMVPFVLAAGAFNYPRYKFLAALGLARAIRYTALAWLASIYGRGILGFLRAYYQPVLWSFITLVVLGSLGALAYYFWHKRHARPGRQESGAAD